MIPSPNKITLFLHLLCINKQDIEAEVTHTAVCLSGHLESLQIVVLVDVGFVGGWGYSEDVSGGVENETLDKR